MKPLGRGSLPLKQMVMNKKLGPMNMQASSSGNL
jgi:hypothetical protein